MLVIKDMKMWPDCFRLGIAAITYNPLAEIDLSKHPKGEPKELWTQLEPSQKASLRRVAYEMKAGDIIYVKQGPKIVGKGIVEGPYQFDAKFRLVVPNDVPWAHQVPVEWIADFPEIKILLGSEPLTVKELSPEKLKLLETTIETVAESNRQKEALEGDFYKIEAMFRSRNRALIQAKKTNSDYCCEVCGFNFEKTYGVIGYEYIVAHHLKPIASGPSKTTLEDIALVCANCHAMIHTKNPPISIEDLRKAIVRR
ncbi:MAG: HNH endonuclease [Chloroflexi bacterium]|nr:HNH endonuclease [Chloroflexota bacterium]